MAPDREAALERFGKSLAQRRKEAGLSQEALAERSGLHPNYIGDVERGERNPTIMTLLALADGLKCSPSDLLREPFS